MPKTRSDYPNTERAKVDDATSEFISRTALAKGWSRSRVIREALTVFGQYEKGAVAAELARLRTSMSELRIAVEAVGRYQEMRFTELEEALAKVRKAVPRVRRKTRSTD